MHLETPRSSPPTKMLPKYKPPSPFDTGKKQLSLLKSTPYKPLTHKIAWQEPKRAKYKKQKWKPNEMQTTSPYTTILVFELTTTATTLARDQLLDALKSSLIAAPPNTQNNPQINTAQGVLVKSLSSNSIAITNNELISGGFVFCEERPVKWDLSSTPETDKINVLVVASLYKGFACLHISDGETRSTIERELRLNISSFPMLKTSLLINPKILEIAFLQDAEIKALWLAGGHKRTAIKANAKLLNGDNLEYALDPLADQTFIARSARAQTIGALSYGVTPRRSAIWRGPNSNFNDYAEDVAAVLERIEIAKSTFSTQGFKPAIPILMNTLGNFKDVHSAYDFGLAEQENMENKHAQRLIQKLNNSYEIEIKKGNSKNQNFSIKATLKKDKSKTINLDITPDIPQNSGAVIFIINQSIIAPEFSELTKAITNHPEVWKCWYQSYHTIVGGLLCHAKRRTTPFNDWIWYDFKKNKHINILKEKPDTFSDIWTTPTDSSLFTWCIKSASGQLGNTTAFDIPGLPILSGAGDVWLYCDDNSREIADFVYFHHNGNDSTLALIHVKGAKSSTQKRKAVPTPYEVVSAQAIKNIMDLESERLLTRIESRLNKSNQKIWNLPWVINTPPTGNSQDLIKLIKIANNAQTKLKIIIVQPHVLASTYFTDKTRKAETKGIGPEQLRTLLHGVKIAAMGVNASLHVIADGV